MRVTSRPLLWRNPLLFMCIALIVPLAAATQALTSAEPTSQAAPTPLVRSARHAATRAPQPSTGEVLPPIFAGVPVPSPDTTFLLQIQPETAAAPHPAVGALAVDPPIDAALPDAANEPSNPEGEPREQSRNGSTTPPEPNIPAGPQGSAGAAFNGPSSDRDAGGLSTTAAGSPSAGVAAGASPQWGGATAHGSVTSTRRTAASTTQSRSAAAQPVAAGAAAMSAAPAVASANRSAGQTTTDPASRTGGNEAGPAVPPADAPAAPAPTAGSPGPDLPQAATPVASEPPADNPAVVGPVTVSPSPGPVLYAGTQLRVLQWNLHHGVGTDGVYDIDRLASWMAAMHPDIVMLNEVEKNDYWGHEDQPARYEAMLESKTGREWYGAFFQEFGDWTAAGKGHLILSTYPFESTDKTVISFSRVIGAARIIVNGRSISLLSTHLDPDSSALRLTQAQEVTRWTAGQPENRILTGDMNAWPDQTSIAELNATYNDSWTVAAAKGMATSFAGLNPVGATKNGRIDYILYSKGAGTLDVLDSRVVDTRDSAGVMPSDHRPVVTTFQVQ